MVFGREIMRIFISSPPPPSDRRSLVPIWRTRRSGGEEVTHARNKGDDEVALLPSRDPDLDVHDHVCVCCTPSRDRDSRSRSHEHHEGEQSVLQSLAYWIVKSMIACRSVIWTRSRCRRPIVSCLASPPPPPLPPPTPECQEFGSRDDEVGLWMHGCCSQPNCSMRGVGKHDSRVSALLSVSQSLLLPIIIIFRERKRLAEQHFINIYDFQSQDIIFHQVLPIVYRLAINNHKAIALFGFLSSGRRVMQSYHRKNRHPILFFPSSASANHSLLSRLFPLLLYLLPRSRCVGR